MSRPLTGLLVAIVIAVASGCSREAPSGEGSFANDLKGAPAPGARPVARVGVADDGVKPAPVTVTKGGVPDDGVKPAPVTVTKGGIPDDSIKPSPPGARPARAPR